MLKLIFTACLLVFVANVSACDQEERNESVQEALTFNQDQEESSSNDTQDALACRKHKRHKKESSSEDVQNAVASNQDQEESSSNDVQDALACEEFSSNPEVAEHTPFTASFCESC